MPDLTLFGRYPLPTGPEAMDLPGQLMDTIEAMDIHTVLFATSAGDRDAKYGDIGPGPIVSTTTYPNYVWKRILDAEGNPGWVTLWEDTGWQDFAESAFGPLWSDNGAAWRRKNGRIDINVRVTYDGDPVEGNPVVGGNIADILIMTLPSGARPVQSQEPGHFLASCCGSLTAAVSGNVTATHLYPGGTLANGTGLYCHLNFQGS